MMQKLIEFFLACPMIQMLKRGVDANYSGKADFTVTEEPSMHILHRYADGDCLVRRVFRAELYTSYVGNVWENCENHTVYERIRDYVFNSAYPEVPDGEIVKIVPYIGGNQDKAGIYEGLMTFKFAVCIKQSMRGGLPDVSYRV